MTLTIDLTLQEETRFNAAARREGLDPETLVKRLMTQLPPTAPSSEALREELDGREERTPAAQALYKRLDEDDARLDRVLALLERRSQAAPSGGPA